MAETKHESRILFTFDTSTGDRTVRIVGAFVYMDEGKVRNFSDDFGRQPLADLVVSAYMSADSTGSDRGAGCWGWSTDYRAPHRVNLERAEGMAKTLRKIRKGLETIDQRGDGATSFAHYCRQVAGIVGATSLGWKVDHRTGWSHDDHDYRWGGVQDLSWHLQDLWAKLTEVPASA